MKMWYILVDKQKKDITFLAKFVSLLSINHTELNTSNTTVSTIPT